jgi:hypothetical protein
MRVRAGCLGLSLSIACASAPPAQDRTPEAAVALLLADLPDDTAVSAFLGLVPPRCIPSSTESQLCEWHVDREQPGWQALSEAIGSQAPLSLICELPVSGMPRARDSCSAHPRVSNRGKWSLPGPGWGKGAQQQDAKRAQLAEQYREMAERWIAQADTLARLSRLMGAIPDGCSPLSAGEQVCLWRTTRHTFGHGTLMAWIGATPRKKIRLRCILPTDGGARAADSCQAEVG